MRIDWTEIPTAPGMRAGATRQAVSAESLSAVRVTTTPDAVFDGRTHRHDNDQLMVMVSGRVQLVIDGDRFWVEAGDLVSFPPGSWHAAVAVGPEGAEYYEIFSPPRLDQLPGWIGPSPLEMEGA